MHLPMEIQQFLKPITEKKPDPRSDKECLIEFFY